MHSAASLPTRRAVLTGALAGLAVPALAACTDSPFAPEPAPTTPPDVVAADRAADRERRLLAAYDAALLLAPQLADRLTPLRADHEVHLTALGVEPEPVPSAAAATATPAPAVPAPPLPADPAALLAALAELERRAASAHGSASVLGGRGLGAVLACLAASEATHAVALQ